MAGYYVPSSYSANYVANKKNEDGTYVYESAANKIGIETQRSLQQLNKQYNITLNQAQAGSLLANRGLRASSLATGYRDAYIKQIQDSLIQETEEATLSVKETKATIFNNLLSNLDIVDEAKQTEVNNMRRLAGGLEQYYDYLKTLRQGSNYYTDDQKFKVGDEWTFEDNYAKLFDTQKGVISNYLDEEANVGLSLEDWLRQNSGSSEDDTTWLDWVYNGGYDLFKDFVKNGVNN